MSRNLSALILVVAVFITTIAMSSSASSWTNALSDEPSGKMCGSYLFGQVKGHGTFNPGQHKFSLYINAFDHVVDCKNIDYTVDKSNGRLVVPDAKHASTCLGNVLIKNKLKAEFVYHKDSNKIELNLGVAKVTLEHC